ncbi:MAG TPA: methyltransferase domain-containing protein [Actinomycetota bacterium]
MSFEAELATRSAEVYADFLLPHVSAGDHVLDVGCGSGSISVGLARGVRRVTGIDPEDGFADAREYARRVGLTNIEFRVGDVYLLDDPDGTYDACLCHSVLEALERPLDALREMRRVLRPGGVLAAASVDYGGLLLEGPEVPLLRRFYEIRERLWLADGADPYRGRALRALLGAAGFEHVTATSAYIPYGTPAAVRAFGLGRAEDCRDEWYASGAIDRGLATASDLEAMAAAWTAWSESTDAYAAFAWCRALGWTPEDAPP